jgi:hypothetical protein
MTLVAVMVVTVCALRVSAEEPVAAEVRALFEAGWKPSLKGLEAAEAHYEKAKQHSPNDVRVPFAMALVYMKNSKLPSAASELDAALAGAKSPLLPIRRARIHLAAVQKAFPEADREMRALATRLAGEPQLGEAEQPFLESAKFLGNLAEYLAGQQETAFRADAVAALDKHILSNLQAERAAAYTAGRAETAKQRTDLEAELNAEKSKALAENTQKREDALEKIEAPVTAAEAQKAGAVAQEKAYREKNESDRARHEPMARQALSQLQSVEREINNLQSRIRNLRSDIDRIKKENEKGKKEKPPKKERDTRREEQELRQVENKLRDLEREKNRLEGNPSVAFMRNYNANLQRLSTAVNASNQNLAAAKKKADNARSALTRTKVNDVSPKTTTLANELKALSTFAQLSLDAEKERILASYRPK